jgi:hypothetical protein
MLVTFCSISAVTLVHGRKNEDEIQLRTLLEEAVVGAAVPHHESTCDSVLPSLTVACWGHMSKVSETIRDKVF